MKIYQNIKNFLYLDIETVREYKSYENFLLEKNKIQLQNNNSIINWERLSNKYISDENLTISEAYEKKASLHAEYGKIVSVCIGRYDSEFKQTIGSISNENEHSLLLNVTTYFDKIYEKYPDIILCGHNIKEFDIPFIVKRMIMRGVKLPIILKNYLSSKPWDQKATDTLFDWKMSFSGRFVSLDLIAEFLNIQSSKNNIVDSGTINEYYWNDTISLENKFMEINNYCKSDVRVLMELTKKIYDVL